MGKPWEQRRLGDFAQVLSASRVHKNEWTGTGVPFFRSSDVVSAFKGQSNEKAFISFDLYKQLIKTSGKLEKDDLLITGGGSIGIPYIVPSNEPLYSKDADLLWIKHSERYISQYLYSYFISDRFREYIQSISHVGTIAHYTIEQVKDTPIPLPSIAEQRVIGAFFQNMDSLISLHQRKLDLLKEQKTGLLQKMFPKNGEDTPEVRFPDFTDPWEQRKFSEVFTEYTEKGHPELPPLMVVQGGGTIRREDSERNLQFDKSNLGNYKKVNQDDFIVHLRSFEGGLEKSAYTGIISPAYHVFHGEKIDPTFYYSFFRSKKFINIDLLPHVYGIRDGRSIDIEGMKTIFIPVPCYGEQKAVGSMIEMMDRLINLNQRKLDLLKEQKKGLLQKMFPKLGEDEPEVRFPEFK